MSLARAFVAVDLPDSVVRAVRHALEPVAPLAGPARWTPAEQWHVTLRFLGRVDDRPGLERALGALASRRAFPLRLFGGGAFPSPRRASVLWIGVDDRAGELTGLARAVGDTVEPLGWPPEDRAYHPHLTVARFARPRPAPEAVAGLEATGPIGPEFRVEQVSLYRSDTRPEGARHHRVSGVTLGG